MRCGQGDIDEDKEVRGSMAFKIGYLLPTRENIMNGNQSTRDLLDSAKRAVDCGFDSVWVGDSLLARPRHEPLTLLSAVALALPGIDIGTAVLLPVLRNPVLLAHQVATLDQLSEGRLILGVGIAADNPAVRSEFHSAGVPFDKRVGRLVETLNLCRALWSGNEVDWDGRWKVESADLQPKSFHKEGPPIWLASGVSKGIERAASYFDGWFPIGPNVEAFRQGQALFERTVDSLGKESDRMTSAIYLTCCVNDDPELADGAINAYLSDYYNAPAAAIRSFQACCGGTVDQVIEFIRSFKEAGARHIVLRFVGDHLAAMRAISDAKERLE